MLKPETYDFLKILISVLIGMFGKVLFDYFKAKIDNTRDRKFIVAYLKNARNIFPILKENYNKIQNIIPNNMGGYEVHDVRLFEAFNTKILSSLSFPRYYRLFGKNASFIYDMYSVVNAIEKDLPIPIYKKLTQSIEQIDTSQNPDTINAQIEQQKEVALLTIKLKLEELEVLESKINSFLSKV